MGIKPLVRGTRRRFEAFLISLCVRFPYLANVYYCLRRDFEREHLAVLVGRRHYYESLRGQSPEGHVYRLRRNVHRLEKGLISRPRRDVFARDYLPETVESYLYLQGKTEHAGDELAGWAQSVLKAYFEAVPVGADPMVDRQREAFSGASCESPADEPIRAPYLRESSPLEVSIEDLLKLAQRRRSVRWYESRPVPREAIDRAIEVAGYAPSACNRQPFHFRVFDDPAMVNLLSGVPGGTKGFNHQFPVFVVLVGELKAYPYARDRHLIYIDGSLAAMSFQFALETQGIASCSINWPDVPKLEKRMAQALNLEPDERVVMCLSLGFPDQTAKVPYSQKKSIDELRAYNRMEAA